MYIKFDINQILVDRLTIYLKINAFDKSLEYISFDDICWHIK